MAEVYPAAGPLATAAFCGRCAGQKKGAGCPAPEGERRMKLILERVFVLA